MLNTITLRYQLSTNAQQKEHATTQTQTEHYLGFRATKLELDPKLEQLTLAMQTTIAIIYCAYYVGRDVGIQPLPGVPQYIRKRQPLIDTIFKDTKEWQSMPNRQDPITHAMIESLREDAVGMYKHYHNSATADWCTLGESTGYIGKE